MKIVRWWSLALASGFGISSLPAAALDDVQYWVGAGAKRAALVLDWNDGKSSESLLWGYRWDGAATGWDMFQAIVAADPRLFANVGFFNFGSGLTPSVLGLGFDLNNSGNFGVTPALPFDGGGLFTAPGSGNAADARTPNDSADHYVEGWNTGFWEYFNKASAGDAWASANGGIGDRLLTDGAWDGLNFNLGFAWPGAAPGEPVAVAAVPEPAVPGLLALSVLVLNRARRRS